MIRTGVFGGAGYVGGEVIRLILSHPSCELTSVTSKSQEGCLVSAVHRDLLGQTDRVFTGDVDPSCEVVFLCGGHGTSKDYLSAKSFSEETTIIDLSRDFRIKNGDHDFTYGLCEMNRMVIRQSRRIANPGCFATCIQLGLLPLAAAGQLHSEVHITAITGATGAGQSPSPTTHFAWRDNNLSVYKAFKHQHMTEVMQSLGRLQPDFKEAVNFVPMRGNFSRGILASIYLNSQLDIDEALSLFNTFYAPSPFVVVTESGVALKNVVNTNLCFLQVQKHGNKLHIVSVIDNLLKGAAGQAIQNMNLAHSLNEDTGLQLKASAF